MPLHGEGGKTNPSDVADVVMYDLWWFSILVLDKPRIMCSCWSSTDLAFIEGEWQLQVMLHLWAVSCRPNGMVLLTHFMRCYEMAVN